MTDYATQLALCARVGVTNTSTLDTVTLDQVDMATSLKCAVRPVDPDTVTRYRTALDTGQPMPPILLEHTPNGFLVLGGLHRLTALAARSETAIWRHGALTVHDITPTQRLALQIGDNGTHGKPLTKPEAIALAARLRDTHTQKDRAALVGLPVTAISQSDQRHKTFERARRLDIAILFQSIKESTGWRLGQIQDDEIFIAAVIAVSDHEGTADRVFPLVTELNKADNPRAVLDQAVAAWEMADAGKARRRGNRVDGYQHLVLGLDNFDRVTPTDLDIEDTTLSPWLITQLRRRILDAAKVLKTALDQIDTLEATQ